MIFGDKNPADVLQDPMWQMFMTFGQEANYPALKKAVYDLIRMSTQKTAGQRGKANDIAWDENLHMTLWTIIIEACALVLSNAEPEDECSKCEYYDSEDNRCAAFECNGIECTELPCEKKK